MDMDIGLSVSVADFRRINIVEPIVGHDFTGNVKNQTAQRIALVGIGIHTPIQMLQILIHGAFDIHETATGIASLCTLFAINNISTQSLTESGIKERVFYGVLNLFMPLLPQRRYILQRLGFQSGSWLLLGLLPQPFQTVLLPYLHLLLCLSCRLIHGILCHFKPPLVIGFFGGNLSQPVAFRPGNCL